MLSELFPKDWKNALNQYNLDAIFQDIEDNFNSQNIDLNNICPPISAIFNAFRWCPYSNTKVIIVGQDPYHTPDTAHGLAFSVNKNKKIPPSLRIIFQELVSDLGIKKPIDGFLKEWAIQGVLLINQVLSVDAGNANSHENIGWEFFSNTVIHHLNLQKEGLVFILWGKKAQALLPSIDHKKHLIITASHPAAEIYSGGKSGFIGHKPFSKTNAYLKDSAINWDIWNRDLDHE